MEGEERRTTRTIVTGYVDAREVGRGGFATVYAARSTATGEVVALKVFHTPDAEGRRIRRELIALERLAGIPNVVPILGVTTSIEGNPVMIMPFLPSTIAERIAHGGVDPRIAVGWLTEIGGAVDQAAALGVHHRDIKPGNVLLDAEGSAHLADFGISALGEMDTGTTTAMAFSPPYAAPERLEGHDRIDLFRSDMYSLAATSWAAIAGDAPFGTATTGGVTGLILRVMANKLEQPAHMPDALFQVLRTGMSLDPALRYPSGASLATAARSALGTSDDTTVSRSSADHVPRTTSTPGPSDVAGSWFDGAQSTADDQSVAGQTTRLSRGAKVAVGAILALGLVAAVLAVTTGWFDGSTGAERRLSNTRVDVVPTLCTIKGGRATLSPGVEWGQSSPQIAVLDAQLTCGLADSSSDLDPGVSTTTIAPLSTVPPKDPEAPAEFPHDELPPATDVPTTTSSTTTPTDDRVERWLDGTLTLTADFDSLGFEGGSATATGAIDWADDRSTDVRAEVQVVSKVSPATPATAEGSSAYGIVLAMVFSDGFGAPGTGNTDPIVVTATFDSSANLVVAIEGITGMFTWYSG